MKSETRILGISGNLRQQSYIRHLLENLVDLMQRMGQPSTSVYISDSRTLFAASTTRETTHTGIGYQNGK